MSKIDKKVKLNVKLISAGVVDKDSIEISRARNNL